MSFLFYFDCKLFDLFHEFEYNSVREMYLKLCLVFGVMQELQLIKVELSVMRLQQLKYKMPQM